MLPNATRKSTKPKRTSRWKKCVGQCSKSMLTTVLVEFGSMVLKIMRNLSKILRFRIKKTYSVDFSIEYVVKAHGSSQCLHCCGSEILLAFKHFKRSTSQIVVFFKLLVRWNGGVQPQICCVRSIWQSFMQPEYEYGSPFMCLKSTSFPKMHLR